ncbi:hypothetical protein [Candidatus Dactylopiibacterium carminicum]|uniref:hypothetical protein n=1 Tax=Candidatus Dactylopiibacterium carminicum TaxID=857335 RepID=UPI001140C916|nr:hypothetical protein [Candidatus Dactylopiibacterium carminicum]
MAAGIAELIPAKIPAILPDYNRQCRLLMTFKPLPLLAFCLGIGLNWILLDANDDYRSSAACCSPLHVGRATLAFMF